MSDQDDPMADMYWVDVPDDTEDTLILDLRQIILQQITVAAKQDEYSEEIENLLLRLDNIDEGTNQLLDNLLKFTDDEFSGIVRAMFNSYQPQKWLGELNNHLLGLRDARRVPLNTQDYQRLLGRIEIVGECLYRDTKCEP